MSSTTLHVGKKRVQAISASDGSTVPAGTVTAQSNSAAVVTTVDPATNDVTLSGANTGSATITYSAPGFVSATETVTVSPQPSLVVTDGPEQ